MHLGLYIVWQCVCVCRAESMRSIHLNFPDVSQSFFRVAEKLHPLGPEMWIVRGCSINLWTFMTTYTCGNSFSTPIWCQLRLKLSWVVVISGWVSPQALHSMGIPTPKLPRGARCKSWDHLVDWGETVSNCKTCCSLVTWLCLRVKKLTLEGSQLEGWEQLETHFSAHWNPKIVGTSFTSTVCHLQRHGLPC